MSSLSRSLVDGLADGRADMSALEQQLDKEAARKGDASSLSRSFKDGGTPASPTRGRLGSGTMMKRPNKTSAPITIQGKPAKTTVGFGSNSFTTMSGSKSFGNEVGGGSGSFKSRSPGGHPKAKKGSPLPPHSTSPRQSPTGQPPRNPSDGGGGGGGGGGDSNSSKAKQKVDAAPGSAAGGGGGGGGGSGKKEKKEKKKAGGPPEGIVKKPKLSKAERRALQEKQRAAKEAKKEEDDAKKPGSGGASKSAAKAKKAETAKDKGGGAGGAGGDKASKAKTTVMQSSGRGHKVAEMVSHLPQNERDLFSTDDIGLGGGNGGLHPMVIQLGLKFYEKKIVGSTSRCIALLRTLSVVVQAHVTATGKDFGRDILPTVNMTIDFLVKCRPHCDSMGNAIKALKDKVRELDNTQSEQDQKDDLKEWIQLFIRNRITLAQSEIADTATTRDQIQDGDVVLTYSTSVLMTLIVTKAYSLGKKFRVIVVDSKPLASASKNVLIQECAKLGIKCTYVLMNAVSYVMREATKVFLSAHSLLANGYVMGKVGTAMIAMTAKAHNVPVLVPCETYKFVDRVQTDSFVFNELGDTNEMVPGAVVPGTTDYVMAGWKDVKELTLLNLAYDVTPPEFVDMVITELGLIPCTSVPVVLRVTEAYGRD